MNKCTEGNTPLDALRASGIGDARRNSRRRAETSVEVRARGFETLRVVASVQLVDAHAAVGRRGVDEALVADVEADVRVRGVARVEEDEVAGAQLAAVDRAPLAGDVGRRCRRLSARPRGCRCRKPCRCSRARLPGSCRRSGSRCRSARARTASLRARFRCTRRAAANWPTSVAPAARCRTRPEAGAARRPARLVSFASALVFACSAV